MAFWNRRRTAWDLAAVTPPWDAGRPSIFSHIQRLVAEGASDLSTLPDDDVVSPPGALRWVAGGLDGAFGHHGGTQPAQQAADIQKALEATLDDPSPLKLQRLYGLFRQSALEHVDALLERLASRRLDLARLEDLAEWIARHAPDREPVKVAIALLGVIPQPRRPHEELLMTLGRHEELTLYVAVALSNVSDRDAKLRQLAEHVQGWGRIQLVERLARTEAPEIKCWLVREGYRNSIMYEYLAYTCATAGGLADELAAAQVDDALLAGAGDILRALIAGGPAQDIDDYAEGALVAERYLHHLGPQPARLEQLLVVDAIRGFLRDDGDWTARASRGWTASHRERLSTRCDAIVALPHWHELATKALRSDDDGEFGVAIEAARVLGIDSWDRHYDRLQAGRDNEWYFVMQTRDPARIDRVLAVAEERLPLKDIASGPAKEMGFGPEWAHHTQLDFVLQGLQPFPGRGWPLIRAGLKSPVIRNRYTALKALAAWERARRPAEAEESLRQALPIEPDDKLRDALATVLDGRPWPPPQGE